MMARLERLAAASSISSKMSTSWASASLTHLTTLPKTPSAPYLTSRMHVSHSNADIRLSDSQSQKHDESGLARSSSLVMSPAITHGTYSSSHSPTLAQPRIFPGIVHERHRRGSLRQGSGSETDGDSMMASGILSERKRPTSSDVGELHLNAALLEEAAEDG